MKSAPIDPVIADLLDQLSKNLQDEFEQRLRSIEFQTDYPHRIWICIELVETLRRNLTSQIHMTCLRVALDGSTEFVLTTDLEYALKHLADNHAEVIAEESIKEIIKRQYDRIAALTFLG